MRVKKQHLEPCMEQLIGSRSRKEYDRAVCCHRLFNLYAEHTVRNAGLVKLQAGIQIGRRNISNLRYANDSTLKAESEEELKSIFMKVEEGNEKAGLKLNIQLSAFGLEEAKVQLSSVIPNPGSSDTSRLHHAA